MELADLDVFRLTPLPLGYPDNLRTLYAPVDQVHAALLAVIGSATNSLIINMYAYADTALDAVVRAKLADPSVFVQMTLDESESVGYQEKAILAEWNKAGLSNHLAIGDSEDNAIMHLKMAVVDELFVITGSTNWSTSGETEQDNQLTVIADQVVAAEAIARMNAVHAWIVAHPS
jgi:phosphatidylserine/phosphatidylglycerophosphate/cardiolipin synthase-like enzyme